MLSQSGPVICVRPFGFRRGRETSPNRMEHHERSGVPTWVVYWGDMGGYLVDDSGAFRSPGEKRLEHDGNTQEGWLRVVKSGWIEGCNCSECPYKTERLLTCSALQTCAEWGRGNILRKSVSSFRSCSTRFLILPTTDRSIPLYVSFFLMHIHLKLWNG